MKTLWFWGDKIEFIIYLSFFICLFVACRISNTYFKSLIYHICICTYIFLYIICIYTHTWIHKYIHSYALVHIMLCIICDVYKVFFLICMLLNSKQDNLRAEYFGILYTREKYIHTYMQNIFLLQSCNIFHIHLALTFCVFLKILKRLE